MKIFLTLTVAALSLFSSKFGNANPPSAKTTGPAAATGPVTATSPLITTGASTTTGPAAIIRPSATTWHANWIAAPGDDGRSYGVYYFRKSLELTTRPATFNVYVSADNRYKLYVNGTLVSLGPARNDIYHWNYATVDLAPYLTTGKNIISAIVWNEADYRPEAQFSFRTAFILQGSAPAEEILNTNNSWKCIKDSAYQPIASFVASAGEFVDRTRTVKDWMSVSFDDGSWPAASHLFGGQPKGMTDGFGWILVPTKLPPSELQYQRIPVLRKATGITIPSGGPLGGPSGFPAQKTAVTIPANTTVTLLLDQTYLTNAYLTLNFSKGSNAGISIRYAESMFAERTPYGMRKGNRNDIEGKFFSGREDSLVSDGSNGQSYTTLNFRTFRYIQLLVQTKSDPLIIDDIYGTFTGYPFSQPSEFVTDSAGLKKILEIGWRTARLNAWETYTDCPYYEQLQYIGDTRVQAVITYFNSSDDRLPRNALDLMDHSRLADGVTMSRYPSRNTQIISTFSLWYIGMLHDYWMYRGDSTFIADKLPGARSVLTFFSKYQQPDGSLKNAPYWTFVDWADGKNWSVGAPPIGADGSSAILDLQLLWAYQWAAEMENKLGIGYYGGLYARKAAQLKQTIQRKYWSPERGLYSDTKEKSSFSQHANSLAILTGMLTKADMLPVARRMLTDSTLTQCTIYFKYYLHQALVKAGLGDGYLDWLGIWRKNIAMGLTTWTEDSNIEFTRSDCHAWGSSPNIEFFRTVLGIDSDAPGFSRIRIEPHVGKMTNLGGEIPHPNGKIAVHYRLDQGKWAISISVPAKTSGIFVWKGQVYNLKPGENKLTI